MIIHENPSTLVPGVGSSYGHGISRLGKYFFPLLLIHIIIVAFGIPTILSAVLPFTADTFLSINVVMYIYSIFVMAPLRYGVAYVYLKAARDEKPDVQDLAVVLRNYGNILLANILTGIIVGIGFFLFFFPGIYFLCKLAFVTYLVTDEKMTALQAIEESWKRTSGYGWTIFFMGVLAIPVMFAGFLLFFFGFILSAMWIEASFASLYHAVSANKKQAVIESEPVQQGPFV